MKKQIWKRALSLGLALVMTVSFAACGKKGGGTAGNAAEIQKLTDEAKNCVYSAMDIDLGVNGNFSIGDYSIVGDRVYMTVDVYDNDTYEEMFMLASMKLDGSDLQKSVFEDMYTLEASTGDFNVEIPENGEAVPGEGEDIAVDDGEINEVMELPQARSAVNEVVAADGEDAADVIDEEAAEKDIPFMEGEDAFYDDMIMPEMPEGTNQSSYYGTSAISTEGVVYALRYFYSESYAGGEYNYEEKSYLDCWDLNGKGLWEVELEGLRSEEQYSYVSYIWDLKDKGVGLLLQGDQTGQIIVDKQGNVSPLKALNIDSTVMDNMGSVMKKADGTLMVSYYEQEDWSKMYLADLDLLTGKLGEGKLLPSELTMGGFYNVFPGYNTDFVYPKGDGIYTYSIGDAEAKKILDFIISDLSVGSLEKVIMVDEEHILGIYNDDTDWSTKVGLFTKVSPENVKDKTTLVLAGVYVADNSQLKKRVIDFNKASEEYRIMIKDYSKYNTEDDYMAGYTQLNNDIIAGNIPDILFGDESSLPIRSYAEKGLLVDIDAKIAQDEELSKIEYMENVFEAFRINGKLYQVIPNFTVQTMIAKKSLVGDRKGWNIQEFNDIVGSMPEGMQVFGEATRSSILFSVMNYCGNEFVDPATGKCDFNTERFISLLKMAKDYPEEIDYSNYNDEDYWMTYQSQYRTNQTLLREMYIGSIQWAKEDINGYMGEDVSFVGFPSENGNGSYVSCYDTFALSSKSKNQDAAWQFVRFYLTGEYQQDENFWGIPIQKNLMLEKAKEAMNKSYYMDENNQKVEYDDTIYINGEEITYSPLSQAQLDELIDFVCSVKTKGFYNEAINTIVTEESAAFFNGQKSAEEVAGLIQNRAQLYVNENR